MSGEREPVIDATLVRRLIDSQFPIWSDLPISPVRANGWNNRTFHLGDHLLVRLPRAERYAPQVEKELRWLPLLATRLPLPISTPVAMGAPGEDYPWTWSVYRWIDGDAADTAACVDGDSVGAELGSFLIALQQIDVRNGPPPGDHNFFRGGPLSTYDHQTRQAIALLDRPHDAARARAIWESALSSEWAGAPVWLHGDVSPGNLVLRQGRLAAVIDFGNLAVGDPACDVAISWTFFDHSGRRAFRGALGADAGVWRRGRGWALWKALIVATGIVEASAPAAKQAEQVLQIILAEDVEQS